jgi:ATP-dependent protease ClpP protease subunit
MPDGNARASRGWTLALRSKDTDTIEISIYDDIGEFFGEGFGAKEFLARLRAAPEAKTIALRINSAGGVVDDAKAMVNLLAERISAGVLVEAYIDGMAASSASYLTTVATRVVMPANAFLMLHEASAMSWGRASDMDTTADLLRKTNDQLASAYASASKRRGKDKSKADYLTALAKGDLYLTADEAIAWGLADERIEPVKQVAHRANIASLGSAPEGLRAAPYVVMAQQSPMPPELTTEPEPVQPAPVAPPTVPNPPVAPPELPEAPPTPTPPAAAVVQPPALPGEPMPEHETQQPAGSEPAVIVSGVKLLGVSTEAEAHARVQALNNLNIALLGMTEKGSIAEALLVVNAWKVGHDQSHALAKKVTELEASTRNARRDGAIEKLSREGRLAPAAHEWARTQFQTAEALESFALTMPPMAQLGPREPIEGGTNMTLTAEEKNVCEALGMPEAAYLEQKKLDQAVRASAQKGA